MSGRARNGSERRRRSLRFRGLTHQEVFDVLRVHVDSRTPLVIPLDLSPCRRGLRLLQDRAQVLSKDVTSQQMSHIQYSPDDKHNKSISELVLISGVVHLQCKYGGLLTRPVCTCNVGASLVKKTQVGWMNRKRVRESRREVSAHRNIFLHVYTEGFHVNSYHGEVYRSFAVSCRLLRKRPRWLKWHGKRFCSQDSSYQPQYPRFAGHTSISLRATCFLR